MNNASIYRIRPQRSRVRILASLRQQVPLDFEINLGEPALRDALLPRLMSGEVRVKEIDPGGS